MGYEGENSLDTGFYAPYFDAGVPEDRQRTELLNLFDEIPPSKHLSSLRYLIVDLMDRNYMLDSDKQEAYELILDVIDDCLPLSETPFKTETIEVAGTTYYLRSLDVVNCNYMDHNPPQLILRYKGENKSTRLEGDEAIEFKKKFDEALG